MNKNKPQSGFAHLMIIVVAVAVLVLGGLGYVYWRNFMQPKSATIDNVKSSNVESNVDVNTGKLDGGSDEFSYAKKVITMNNVADVVNEVEKIVNTNKSLTIDRYNGGPIFKPSSVDYFLFPKIGTSISIKDSSVVGFEFDKFNYSMTNSIPTFLTYNKFQKYYNDSVDNDQYDDFLHYKTTSVVCMLSKSGSPMIFSCADISDYAAAIAIIDPFAKVFKAGYDGDFKDIVFSIPNIRSGIDGYQNAKMSVNYSSGTGGMDSWFYRKSSGDWKYFKSTQNVFVCSEYRNIELKYSFFGDTCWNDETKKDDTVKL